MTSSKAIISLTLAVYLGSACDDATAPTVGEVGTIDFVVVTVGPAGVIDPDGYSFSIDGESSRPIGVSGQVTIRNLSPGTHTLRLEGVAFNCLVNSANPQIIDVPSTASLSPISVVFSVSCRALSGAVRISTVTSGVDPDSNGYRVYLPEVGDFKAPSTGTLTITGVKTGELSLILDGVSGNCLVDHPRSVTVTVAHAAIVDVSFAVRCVQGGGLVVTTVTTGDNIDSNGYVLSRQLEGGGSLNDVVLPASGSTSLSSMIPGTYQITVTGVMTNCDLVGPYTRSLVVGAGAPTPLIVEVVCAKPLQLTFVYGAGSAARIYFVNSDGNGFSPMKRFGAAHIDTDPAWSPDGRSIAFSSARDGDSEIFTMNGDATEVQLTSNTARDYRPAWSPDGKRIAFVSDRDGDPELYVMNSDGSNVVRLTQHPGFDSDPDWSPDGRRIAFTRHGVNLGGIYSMNADGSDIVQLSSTAGFDHHPAWSPDGTRLAFSRHDSNFRANLFQMDADGSNVKQLTFDRENAADPAWSPDGRQIAFSLVSCTGYYDYYCDPHVAILKEDGTLFVLTTSHFPAFNPTWRR